MLTSKLPLTALVVLALGSSVAQAENPPAPEQGEVSEINGELVEVGDHNRYDYRYKRFNIGTNPIAAGLGMYSLQGSMALSSVVALRADAAVLNDSAIGNLTGVDVTASVAVYFKKMYQGLYLEPGLVGRKWKGSKGYAGVQTLVGYQQMWDSGLNASVAYGAGRKFGKSGSERTLVNGYIRFGYAF